MRIFALLGVFLLAGCSYMDDMAAQKKLYTIRHGAVEIGILTNAGGRIVLLRVPGGRNVLESDRSLWVVPPPPPPLGALKKEYREYGGNIVWTGPHSRWWQEQNVIPGKRGGKGKWPWPPDPYLSFGSFKIVSNVNSVSVFAGEVSPVSGVSISKEIRTGSVITVRTTASNGRGTVLSRDIWNAAMLDADARMYVPVVSHRSVRFQNRGLQSNISWEMTGGHVSARIRPFTTNTFIESDKAFITPRAGYAGVFVHRTLWLIVFALQDAESISSEHGAVEISATAKETREQSGFMLSRHSALAAIPPGGTIRYDERWALVPYRGADTDADRIAFLEAQARDIEPAMNGGR